LKTWQLPLPLIYYNPVTLYTLISVYLALKTEWLLDVPPGLTFKNNSMSPQFIDVLTTGLDFYNSVGECFLRGMS